MSIMRYEISAYCYRCGSAEGSVVVDTYEDKEGTWVKYEDHLAELKKSKEAV